MKIVFNEKVIPHFIYMLFIMCSGIFLIQKYASRFHKCTLRKLFHILALLIFTPSLLNVKSSRQIQQFVLFAFNAVSVWLIMIE